MGIPIDRTRNDMIRNHQATPLKERSTSSTFGTVMNGIADGALATASTIGKFLPGGELLSLAADGLKALKDGSPNLSGGDDQIDQMWAMQKENQAFNMQYLQLQTELQSDNRRFSTMSNLMKARHDTAKSAINNMHV